MNQSLMQNWTNCVTTAVLPNARLNQTETYRKYLSDYICVIFLLILVNEDAMYIGRQSNVYRMYTRRFAAGEQPT